MKIQKIISAVLVIAFLNFSLPFNLYSDDFLGSQQNQSDLIPVSGASGPAQTEINRQNNMNTLLTGAPAEPTPASQAITLATGPIAAAKGGIDFGFAKIFKMLFEALGKTALPVPALSLTGSEDTAVTSILPTVDFMNRPITYQVTKAPTKGSVTFTTSADQPGKIVLKYIPNANFNGTDSFEYKSIMNGLSSAPALVSLNVGAVNDDFTLPIHLTKVFDHTLGHQISFDLGPDKDTIDNQALTYKIEANLPQLIGTATVDPATGMVKVDTGVACADGIYTFDYSVTDGVTKKTGKISVEMKNCPVHQEDGGGEGDHEHVSEIGQTFKIHTDNAPNFADALYAKFPDGTPRRIVEIAHSGNLSDIKADFNIGAEDVLILTGEVIFDMENFTVHTLALYPGAHLKFKTDSNTRLNVVNLIVAKDPHGYGHLEIGSIDHPIAANVKAEVVFRDQPIDLAIDPLQYGNGMIVMGKISVYGREMAETFIRSAVEPRQGDKTLTLAQVPAGWLPGDILEIPDTRQLTETERNTKDPEAGEGNYNKILSWTEKVRIVKIEGKVITFEVINEDGTVSNAGLKHDHLGAYNLNGALEFLGHVVNISRNVVFRSENPEGTRGHSLYTQNADVDIRYAGFEDMGRTMNIILNSAKTGENGTIKPPATDRPVNQIGRYSMHFHHLVGVTQPAGDGRDDSYQYTIIGNAIVQNLARHDFKWGIAVHNSHYGLISQNVVFNPRGAGIVTEDGSETGNVFDKNYVLSSTGSGDRGDGRTVFGDFGHDGVGFWFRGTNNIVRNNVAADIHGKNDNSHFGFKYFPYQNGNGEVIKVPAFKGADVSKAGQYALIDPNKIPMAEFKGNEVYGAASGMTYWWVGMMFETPREGPPTIIKDFTVWHIYGTGFFHYPAANILIDNYTIINQVDARHPPTGSGWSGADYGAYNITIQNSRIEGMRVGIVPSTKTSRGLQIYRNLTMHNMIDFSIGTIWTSAANAEAVEPRKIIIDNVKAGSIPGKERDHKFISMKFEPGTSRTANTMILDEVFVKDYTNLDLPVADQKKLSFQVFYEEQLGDYVPPEPIFSPWGPYPMNVGSPEFGLTNKQLMAKYGEAIAGAAAPDDAGTMREIDGLVYGTGADYEARLSSIPVIFGASHKIYKNDNGKFDMVVTWYTTKATDSAVKMSGGSTKTTTNSALTKFHGVTVTDLDPAKEYGYVVSNIAEQNKAGNVSMRLPTTDKTVDIKDPVITELKAAVSIKEAQIRWTTNESTTSYVEYGLDTNYGKNASSDFYTTSEMRELTLKNLEPGKTYHYRVTTVDAAGRETTSDDKTFTVPVVTSPRTGQLFANDVEITYELPAELAGAQLYYAIDPKGSEPYTLADGSGKIVKSGLSEGRHTVKVYVKQGNAEVPKTAFSVVIYVKSRPEVKTAVAIAPETSVEPSVPFTFQYYASGLGSGHVHCAITATAPEVSDLNALPNVIMDLDKDGNVQLMPPATEGQYWVTVWPVTDEHQATGTLSTAPLLVSSSLQSNL